MLKLNIFASLFIALFLNGCCCGPDDAPFQEPCNPVILGPKNLTTKFNFGQFGKGINLSFKNGLGYTSNYYLDTAVIKYVKGEDCDTSYLFERRNAKYQTDAIAPKIEFDLSIQELDSNKYLESYLIKIGDFYFSLINKDDIIKNYVSNSSLIFLESMDVFNIKLENVYHLYFNTPKNNEIKGIYYSLENGLMAFYIDNEHFWIRQ